MASKDDPTDPPKALRPERLTKTHRGAQWVLLVLLSVLFVGIIEALSLPAALLIGPMLAAIVAGTNGATIRVPKFAFTAGQALVGCLVASSISLSILSTFASEWPLFLVVVMATLIASSFLGWFVSRLKIMPGSTAVWGSAPGGATAMVLMAEAFGADARLVAFMQYLRVIFVSILAALVARLWVDTSAGSAPPIVWFPTLDLPVLAGTLAVTAAGALAGLLLRFPSPYFLGVVLVGSIVHLGFAVPFQLPHWLLAAAYIAIGWTIGLNFTRTILLHAARALPQIVASMLVLIAFCGGIAFLLSHELGIDPLTAYLATSPGGLDTVAIIAAASHTVDISFVLALQTLRLIMVMLFGPILARLVSRALKD